MDKTERKAPQKAVRRKGKGTRKLLAQELGIPMSQINRVVAAIHKQLGHSIPDNRLLELVRHKPESRELFRQIQQNLFPTESNSAQAIQPPTTPHSIHEELTKTEIHQLANLLAVPIQQAVNMYSQIKTQIQVSFADSDLLAVVKASKFAAPTVDQIVTALETHLLVTKLSISEQEARQLPHEVKDRLRLQVTFNDILQFLEIATPPVNIQDIHNYFYREWKSAYDLAHVLHISENEAWQYMVQIREQVSWSVPHQQLLDTVKQLPYNQKTPQDIVLALNIRHIAQQLTLSVTAAHTLIDKIHQDLAEPVSSRQIANAIPFFDRLVPTPYEKQFSTLWEIATTLQLPIEQAGRFFQQIKGNAPPGTTFEEIGEAFNEVSIQNISIPSVSKKLIQLQTARQLGLTMDQFDQLPGEISEEIDAIISEQHIIEIVHELGRQVSLAQVKDYFWRIQYPIPQIATAVGMDAAMARSLLGKIKQSMPFQVDDDEILAAINSLPSERRKLSDILDMLHARRIVAQDSQQARELLLKIAHAASGKEITTAWETLPSKHKTLDDLVGFIRVRNIWKKSFPETLKLIQKIQPSLDNPISLSQLCPLIQDIPATLQKEKGIVTYLNLRHLLRADNPTPFTLSRLATEVMQHHHENRFWNLVRQYDLSDKLTVRDIEYLLTLVKWAILHILTPERSKDEHWLTYNYLHNALEANDSQHVWLENEHHYQSSQLKAYSQKCWQIITSKKRQYQVPSNGRAEVIVPAKIASLLNLYSVRFVQEQVNAPGLFVQFKFETPALIGIMQIDPSGKATGFHHLVDDSWFQALIEAVAFSHYRDLVVPEQINPAPRLSNHRQTNNRHIRTEERQTTKPFPTIYPRQKRYSLSDWYESQEIARHNVRGHTRWIESGFIASDEKYDQAKKAGVTLQNGYTWVIEHERGNPRPTKIPLNGIDLAGHTIFMSPPRAEYELEQLLFLANNYR